MAAGLAGGARVCGQSETGSTGVATDGALGHLSTEEALAARRGASSVSVALRDVAITRPNQVWAADICYVPMAKVFVYLVAIRDWASRRVLAWRLSNTLDSHFCVEALEEALAQYGPPEIFNTDQGAQFTSDAFTTVLKGALGR